MAKLGMPNVIVSFKEAGIAAIERSKRGIVALILEEEQSIIDELTTNKNAIVGSAICGEAICGIETASEAMPTRPSGTRIQRISKPLGRRQDMMPLPTGSFKLAI